MSVYFTDTDCELWYTDVDKYDIKVIGMPYTLDGEEKFYDMGRATDFKHLFQRMREGAMPITSALNPQMYIDYFEPYFAAGEDILYVHFSEKMSGTFEYMRTAENILKEKYPKRKLTVVNTRLISGGAGMIVLEGAKMHAAGKSDEEIVAALNELSKHISIDFVVDSLAHLRRGGRISAASAMVGSILNIKPMLSFDDEGAIQKFGTQKGMKKALVTLCERVKSNIQKVDKYPVWVIDADSSDMADFFEKYLEELIPKIQIVRYPIGPVIGTHCGPGTIGIIYYGEKRM